MLNRKRPYHTQTHTHTAYLHCQARKCSRELLSTLLVYVLWHERVLFFIAVLSYSSLFVFPQPPCTRATYSREYFFCWHFSFIYAFAIPCNRSVVACRLDSLDFARRRYPNDRVDFITYARDKRYTATCTSMFYCYIFWMCDLVQLFSRGLSRTDEWPWNVPRDCRALTSGHCIHPHYPKHADQCNVSMSYDCFGVVRFCTVYLCTGYELHISGSNIRNPE